MRVFSFLDGAFDGIHPWIIVGAGLALLLADFFIALRAKKEGVFVALALLTGSLCFLPVYLSLRFTYNDTVVFGILLIALEALFYLFLLLVLKKKEKDRLRREKKLQESRQAMFTLPDRENTFVRDRLNTSLQAAGEEKSEGEEYDLEESKLRLNHVREMLAKLKSAPLSPGDRLETEGISRLITLYATKNLLSAKEIRDLNDCLSAVLKMTAKYAL